MVNYYKNGLVMTKLSTKQLNEMITNEIIYEKIDYVFQEQFTDVTDTLEDFFEPLKDFPTNKKGLSKLRDYCKEQIFSGLELEEEYENDVYTLLEYNELFNNLFSDKFYFYNQIYKLKF